MNNKKNFRRLYAALATTMFLGFFLFIYNQFQTASLQTIISFNSEFVERVNTISDSMLNNIKTSAMQMFYISSVKTLRTSRELNNSQTALGLRDLGNFVSSSDFLDSVMIYNSKMGMIFTSDGTYNSVKDENFYDPEAMKLLMEPENYPYLSPIRRHTPSGVTYSFLFFESRNKEVSSLLVNVSDKWYTSRLLGMSENSNYVIVDENGTLIAGKNELLFSQLSQSWEEIFQEIEKEPYEGFFMPSPFSKSPGWMYHKMSNSDWYYLKPFQIEAAAPGLIRIRNFLFLSFILIGGSLIPFTAYMLIKVYLPLNYIRSMVNPSGSKKENISAQVEQLVAYRQENKTAQYLSELHSGILPPEFSFPVLLIRSDTCNLADVQAGLRNLFPLFLAVPDGNGFLAAASNSDQKQKYELLQYLSPMDSHRFYISSLCQTSKELTENNLALEELYHLRLLYPGHQFFHSDLLNQCNEVSGLNAKTVSALTTALKSGQADAALLHWQDFFASIQRDRYSDFCFAIQFMCKQLNQLQTELELTEQPDISLIPEDFKDIHTLHADMKQLFTILADGALKKKLLQLSELSSKIDQVIRLRYADSSFTPQKLAEHFHMSTAYLSRQYQQITGISISDAIHKVRIDQACLLLKKTEEPAEWVSQQVGYDNSKYFFVLFKKWTGHTPKQYRTASRTS